MVSVTKESTGSPKNLRGQEEYLKHEQRLGDGEGSLQSQWNLLYGNPVHDHPAPAWTLAVMETSVAFLDSTDSQKWAEFGSCNLCPETYALSSHKEA